MKILITAAASAALLAVLALAPVAAVADSSSDCRSCASGLARSIDTSQRLGPDAISAATSAIIEPVNRCAASDVTSSLASKGGTYVQPEIQANPQLVSKLQSQGYGPADILGASLDNNLLTIYVTAKTN